MFLLILDSLGSTELLFILVMALVFFGPRKLPQLSRSLGKSLAEFRRASEDFKRTWEREVALEESRSDVVAPAYEDATLRSPDEDATLRSPDEEARAVQDGTIEAVAADRTISRQSISSALESPDLSSEPIETTDNAHTEAPRKQEWL